MCEYHFLNVCWSDLNSGGGSGTIKSPVFLLFECRHTPLRVSVPAGCTHTRLTGQEARTGAGRCSEDQRVSPLCGAQTVTIFTVKFNQVMQNPHRVRFLSLFVRSLSVPLSLCQSSWCLKVQMWCLAGTVSGERESSGKWSCFEKPFRHLV